MTTKTTKRKKPRPRKRAPVRALPSLVSQVEIATLLGVTPQSIRLWTVDGMPRDKGGKYDPAACVAWALERAEGRRHEERTPRVRKEAAEADLKELDLAERLGKVMTVKDFDRVVLEAFARVKSHLLTLPARGAHDFVGLTSQKAARATLKDHVGRILRALEDPEDEEEDG